MWQITDQKLCNLVERVRANVARGLGPDTGLEGFVGDLDGMLDVLGRRCVAVREDVSRCGVLNGKSGVMLDGGVHRRRGAR
jgi:hypothetical protein